MYDVRRLQPAQYAFCRAFVCGLGLAALSLTAHSAIDVPADAGYQRFRAAVTGNAITMKFSSGGLPLASAPGYPTGMRMTALGPTTAEASRYAAAQTKYGPVSFRAAQAFSKGAMASSFARMAMNPYFALGMIALPYAMDWFNDSGVFFNGQGVASISDSTWNDGFEYGGSAIGWSHSFRTACGLMGSYLNSNGGGYSFNSGDVATLSCKFTHTNGVGYTSTYNTYVFRRVQTSPPGTLPPATEGEIYDKLYNQPRTESEIERIIAEGIKYPELMPDPSTQPVVKPTSDGLPIESTPKTSTSTKVNPDGSKSEELTTCRVVGKPAGPVLELSEKCSTTTTTFDPSGNVTGTSTSTTNSETSSGAQPEKPQEEEKGFCESLVGKVICADMDTPSGDPIDKQTRTISYASESHFSGGSCPADKTMVINGQSLKVWDWSASCGYINQYFRPLFLTLCAFTALMILAPAVKE